MADAVWPHRAVYITPMAAVAGAVADEMLAALVRGRTLDKAYVNDGGDIAIHLTPGQTLRGRHLRTAIRWSTARRSHDSPVRGIATSGCGGRSFSLGIADSATVLAATAAAADAAATLIANAVNVDHPAIERRPACELDPDSDLLDLPVTVAVGPLPPPRRRGAGPGAAEARRLAAPRCDRRRRPVAEGQWRIETGGMALAKLGGGGRGGGGRPRSPPPPRRRRLEAERGALTPPPISARSSGRRQARSSSGRSTATTSSRIFSLAPATAGPRANGTNGRRSMSARKRCT